MAKRSSIVQKVKGCASCPFAVHAGYCGLHKSKIDITPQLEAAEGGRGLLDIMSKDPAGPFPEACPLKGRRAEVTLQWHEPEAGRPLKRPEPTGTRNIKREGDHLATWLRRHKQAGKKFATVKELAKADKRITTAHFTAALAGIRPFYFFELDAVVAYAHENHGYEPERMEPRSGFEDEPDILGGIFAPL